MGKKNSPADGGSVHDDLVSVPCRWEIEGTHPSEDGTELVVEVSINIDTDDFERAVRDHYKPPKARLAGNN